MTRRNVPEASPVLLALTLVLFGVWWGLPRAVSSLTVDPWGYDELAPLAPLVEARGLFRRPVSGYLAYPVFHYVVLTVSYVPYMAVKFLAHEFRPAARFPYGMVDPVAMCRDLTLIARLVSVAMAVGIVFLIRDIIRTLLDRQAALWAALLAAVLPGLAYYGKTSNLDTPYIFWLMLATRQVARILAGGERMLDYALLGVFAALSACTKDQALGFVAGYPFVVVLARWSRAAGQSSGPSRLLSATFGPPMLVALLSAVVSFALAGNLILDAAGFQRHVKFATVMARDYRMYPADVPGQVGLAWLTLRQLALLMGPGLLLAIVGAGALARRRRWDVLALGLTPVVSHHLLIVARVGYSYPRFQIAPALFLTILAAGTVWDLKNFRKPRLVRALVFASLAYGLIASVYINASLVADARHGAERWVNDHAPAGATVEAYVTHPHVLPRVWDRHPLHLVPAGEMTAADLARRTPDFIILTDLQDASRRAQPEPLRYLDDLEAGTLGYTRVYHGTSIGGLVHAQIPCVCASVRIYQRSRPAAAADGAEG